MASRKWRRRRERAAWMWAEFTGNLEELGQALLRLLTLRAWWRQLRRVWEWFDLPDMARATLRWASPRRARRRWQERRHQAAVERKVISERRWMASALLALLSPRAWWRGTCRAWDWFDFPGLARGFSFLLAPFVSVRFWQRQRVAWERERRLRGQISLARAWSVRWRRLRRSYRVQRKLGAPPWARAGAAAMVPMSLLTWMAAGSGGRPDGRLQLRNLAPELPAASRSRPEKPSSHPAGGPLSTARLADQYLEEGFLSAAAEEYSRALQRQETRGEALLGLAKVARRADAPGDALQLAEAAVRERPKDAGALNTLALVQAGGGQSEQAARTFVRALEAAPKDVGILLNASVQHARLGHWAEAEATCQRAVDAAPREVGPRMLQAALALGQGERDRGAAVLEQLARDHPDDASVHQALGRAQLIRNRLPDALAAFRVAQRLRPEWPVPRVDAGLVYFYQGQPGEAEREFRKALRLAPTMVAAQLGLATMCEVTGRAAEAVAAYEQALTQQSNLPLAANNLAYHYAEQGEHLDRALQLARQATTARPQHGAAWDTLGWVYWNTGQRDQALAAFRKASQLSPQIGIIRYHLARALAATGQPSEAVAAFREALERPLAPAERRDAEQFLQRGR